MTHDAVRQQRPRRIGPVGAVAVLHLHQAEQVADAVGGDLVMGQDGGHARGSTGGLRVEPANPPMGHRRSQDDPAQRARRGLVVGIATAPGDQHRILGPPDALSDPELHEIPPPVPDSGCIWGQGRARQWQVEPAPASTRPATGHSRFRHIHFAIHLVMAAGESPSIHEREPSARMLPAMWPIQPPVSRRHRRRRDTLPPERRPNRGSDICPLLPCVPAC